MAFWTALVIFLSISAQSLAADPVEMVRGWQRDVKTVKAEFVQEKHTELLDRPIRSKGEFYFKSPVGVRWQYGEDMTVVYDGKDLYIYYIELGEAEKVEGVSGFVGPLSFDIGLLLRDYDVQAEETEGGVRLELRPRRQMPFERMTMFFPEGAPFPAEVRIFEQSGDSTTITFHGVRTNLRLKDGLFKFTPPPGVTLRERRLR